ncbi:MAG TPA: AI-2E family transporter [Gemmatimonadaceae bacterium]|jgi:predicted PurR-regulated permease PerM
MTDTASSDGSEHGRVTGEVARLTRASTDPSNDPPAPEANLASLEAGLERVSTRSIELTILVVLAVFYTLYFARGFIVPVVFAVLANLFLSPLMRVLRRAHLPNPVGAALVILALLAILGGGAYAVSGPAQEWIAKAPHTLATVNTRLRKLRKPVDQVTRTAEQVVSAAGTAPSREVTVGGPSLVSRVFGTTTSFVAGLLEVIVLLYFLLAGGELFLQKLIKVLPQLTDKKTAVIIARETESSISTYLSSLLLINSGEGLVVGFALYFLGMPNPVLWGVLAALLEFVPYLGAATMFVILTMAGLTTFPDVGHALLVPASFLAVSVLQANFVSPMLLGRRLTLNPVAIFVGLALWFFMWGIPGALIAVPLLAAVKIFCEHIESLASISEFLGK